MDFLNLPAGSILIPAGIKYGVKTFPLMAGTDSTSENFQGEDTCSTPSVFPMIGSMEYNNSHYTVGSKRDPAHIWGYYRKLTTNGAVVSEGLLLPDSVQSCFVGIKQSGGSFIIGGIAPNNYANYQQANPWLMNFFQILT